MEDVLEKLRWLNYEQHFVYGMQQRRVSRDEFIVSARNPGLQYNLYIHLLKWLLTSIELKEGENENGAILDFQSVDTYDDPNVIAQKLMLVLRILGYEIDFPITKLKQAHGEEAISILNFLADKALNDKGFQHEQPKYITLDKLKSNDFNTKQDEEDIILTDEETFEDSSDSIELSYEISKVNNQRGEMDVHQLEKDHDNQEQFELDQWKAELERVSPALEDIVDACDYLASTPNDWRTIIRSALKEHSNMTQEVDRSREVFERLSKETNRSLELIETKEDVVNEKFSHFVDDYQIECEKVRNLKRTHDESSALVNDLREEVTNLSRKVDEVKLKVDEKGNKMTDTSPLIQIKNTLKEMKAEIRDYDLQIGVLEHNLLQRRIVNSKNLRNTTSK